MKISTRVEYGLIALTDIVIYGENGVSVSAPDISKRQNISHKYLEHILLLLRQAGFITAQKGQKGGYVLACSPEEVPMSDVINALDNNILGSSEAKEEGGLGPVINDCFWDRINGNLYRYLEGMKLSDFANQCRSRIPGDWDLYII